MGAVWLGLRGGEVEECRALLRVLGDVNQYGTRTAGAGNLKSVANGGHLDDTPRMRLVDAVDAFGDNRGELVFELRGATQRQFAMYRVLRGTAEKVFVSGGSEIVTLASE